VQVGRTVVKDALLVLKACYSFWNPGTSAEEVPVCLCVCVSVCVCLCVSVCVCVCVCAYTHTHIRNVCKGGSVQEREPQRDRQRDTEEEKAELSERELFIGT
jgi:hypothetical protein